MSATDIGIEKKLQSQHDCIQQLRDELKNKNIGDGIQYEDNFLLKFLRCKNYNIQECCEMIKNYIDMFKNYPELFNGVEICKTPFEDGFFQICPQKNVTGETIAIIRIGLWDPDQYSYTQCIMTTVYGFEFEGIDPEMNENGVIEIIDVAELGFRHFLKMGMSEMKMGSDMTEKTIPIKWRKLFVAFENPVVDVLYNICKPFISRELKEKIVFLGSDMNKLHETVPPELLPSRYGGTSDKYDHIEYYEMLKSNESALMSLWKPFKDYHHKKSDSID